MHRDEARTMKLQFPAETQGLSVIQVEEAWEEYSGRMSAGWLMVDPENGEDRIEVLAAMATYKDDRMA